MKEEKRYKHEKPYIVEEKIGDGHSWERFIQNDFDQSCHAVDVINKVYNPSVVEIEQEDCPPLQP